MGSRKGFEEWVRGKSPVDSNANLKSELGICRGAAKVLPLCWCVYLCCFSYDFHWFPEHFSRPKSEPLSIVQPIFYGKRT